MPAACRDWDTNTCSVRGVSGEVGYAMIKIAIRKLPVHRHERQAAHQMHCSQKIKCLPLLISDSGGRNTPNLI